jgi:hypothetical protein
MAIVNLNVDYTKRKIVGSVNGAKPDESGNVEVSQNRVETINLKTPDPDNGEFTIASTFMKDISPQSYHMINFDIDPSKQLVVQTVNGTKPDPLGNVDTIKVGRDLQISGIISDFDFNYELTNLPTLLMGNCYLQIGNQFPHNLQWNITIPPITGAGCFFIKGSPSIPLMESITITVMGGSSLLFGLDFFAATKYTFINSDPYSKVKFVMTNCDGIVNTINNNFIEVSGCDLSVPVGNSFNAITIGTETASFIHAANGARVNCPIPRAAWPVFSAAAPKLTQQMGGDTGIYLAEGAPPDVGTHICNDGGHLQIGDKWIHPIPATATPPTKK